MGKIKYHYAKGGRGKGGKMKNGNAMKLPYNDWEVFRNRKKKRKKKTLFLRMLVNFFFAQFATVVSLPPVWNHHLQP